MAFGSFVNWRDNQPGRPWEILDSTWAYLKSFNDTHHFLIYPLFGNIIHFFLFYLFDHRLFWNLAVSYCLSPTDPFFLCENKHLLGVAWGREMREIRSFDLSVIGTESELRCEIPVGGGELLGRAAYQDYVCFGIVMLKPCFPWDWRGEKGDCNQRCSEWAGQGIRISDVTSLLGGLYPSWFVFLSVVPRKKLSNKALTFRSRRLRWLHCDFLFFLNIYSCDCSNPLNPVVS